MSSCETYPKRLIEVDLPIKRISAHARREKAIRHGHISTLHIWWARRPLAACRAVICASLWPDPADPQCPQAFIKTAREQMLAWLPHERQKLLSEESRKRFEKARQNPASFNDVGELRSALLDFIADFANWDNSNSREYIDTSRALTQAAHEALGGVQGTHPLVIDPFAGGGAIPLEALRVGADAFASDLNPVAVLLNKVVLEYIPHYGSALSVAVRKWGDRISKEVEKDLAAFYPKDADGRTPIAYLWARTIQCEGPNCGAEVPLIRSLWLAKKGTHSAFRIIKDTKNKRLDVDIVERSHESAVGSGTVRKGSATCPICGFTTKVARVRAQLRERHGGASDARMIAVVTTRAGQQGRWYRVPNERDLDAAAAAATELERRAKAHKGPLSLVPDESTAHYHSFVNRGPIYGMTSWADYYTPRQALALSTFVALVRQAYAECRAKDSEFAKAVATCLAMAVDRQADATSSLCRWHLTGEKHTATFGRQALPMVWDFSEVCVTSQSTGGFPGAVEWVCQVCDRIEAANLKIGSAERFSATEHPLPDDAAQAFITDPPYYYSVQYADLSDYFYVWLRRSLAECHPSLLADLLTPKDDEIIVQSPGHQFAAEGKNKAFYESKMKDAMAEGRRVLAPSGVGLVVFAHTSTAAWEAQLQAMVDAGWIVTGSWPIDTEMATRVLAQNRSVLASSIHLVCRPREKSDGSVRIDSIGDWRDVLAELPKRIHEWMPRLAAEGVIGADAIFACLGPALEVFSRFSRVEKASGEPVLLKEYLEHVWAAVSKEALNMIFIGADATSFEEDARLTAMWLWTLSSGGPSDNSESEAKGYELGEDEETGSAGNGIVGGFVLEYDAARKIAQGLGAHLEALSTLIEVKGSVARLLPVAERTRSLFQKGESATLATHSKAKKKTGQLLLGFVAELEEAEETGGWGAAGAPQKGESVLDRVHQSMILFGAGRGEALKRFLVEDGVGRDDRFWRLAQAFSALYPPSTDEKRWVDGVLARKRGFGF